MKASEQQKLIDKILKVNPTISVARMAQILNLAKDYKGIIAWNRF